MEKQFVLFLFISSVIMSCGQTYRLSEEDYKWMPYTGNETLIFKSNKGDIDTIFLLKKDTLIAYPEAQSMNGIKYEIVSIFCKHSEANISQDNRRYLENIFFQVEKAKDKRTELNIRLIAKDAKFYRLSLITVDSLNNLNPVTVQTSFSQYDDVYIIRGEDYLGNFSERSNFITKVYWSKSKGLIRYDKKEAIYWELEKKY